ncbi:hypothetical protein ABT097_28090 [Streptomyces sp. NPDC002225]|uniref:hypothetical protein n=1 Tax=Streptomyces sp. NPDC002225 TaxID=3154413 RepID=UPI00331F15A3
MVEAKVRTELAQVIGFAGPADAPQILADRRAQRLENQMRLGSPITDPAGWLIGRGLPQIRLCAEPRCDDGTLLGSGRDCPRCEDRQADSRATTGSRPPSTPRCPEPRRPSVGRPPTGNCTRP